MEGLVTSVPLRTELEWEWVTILGCFGFPSGFKRVLCLIWLCSLSDFGVQSLWDCGISLHLSNLVFQLHKLVIIQEELLGEDWLIGRATYSRRFLCSPRYHSCSCGYLHWGSPFLQKNPFSYGRVNQLPHCQANVTREEKYLPCLECHSFRFLPIYLFIYLSYLGFLFGCLFEAWSAITFYIITKT